jgi:hypothetical protein
MYTDNSAFLPNKIELITERFIPTLLLLVNCFLIQTGHILVQV